MSKPGRKYKYEALGSPLGASRGGEEAGGGCAGTTCGAGAEDGRTRPGAPVCSRSAWRAGAGGAASASQRGRSGTAVAAARPPLAQSASELIDLLFPGESGRAALAPPAPARVGPPSSLSCAAAGAPMPRAAPRWPPLLLLLLLLLLPPPPPLARGAPARPGARGQASELVEPTRLPGSAGELTFHLSAFGKGFVLRLAPDASFLAPNFKIERLGGSGGAAGGERELRDCFFSGTVNGEPESLAAVSLCRGLSGSFLLDGEEFTIQPQGAGGSLHQPHRLQRWGPGPRRGTPGLAAAAASEAHPLPGGPEWEVKGGGQRQEKGDEEQEKEEEEEEEEEETEEEEEVEGKEDAEGASEQPPPLGATSRTKRFVSEARFVETLLVADASMAAFYGADLQNHVLTLMSVAARIYKHPSIRNSINLMVVKVLIVEDEKWGPEVSDNGGLTLRNFCNWQRRFNQPSDRHPEHFDTAILLTRQNFCGKEGMCDTLGVADIGTICDPNKSCSVIEDEGLQAAYTLAHELGHVLSMPHDDSKPCARLFGPMGKHHMMAPLFVHLNKTLPWSPCSAMYLTELLDGGHGDCLLDAPTSALPLPTDLPGRRALYELDQQCKQIFGLGFRHCPNTSAQDICAQLWCHMDGAEPLCHTKNGSLPWADGTPCGPGHLCWDGSCLPEEEVDRPKAVVDGGWAPWGPWGECSRTCGGGVQFSHRECKDPEPQNGGRYCLGRRAKYQSCHTEECPPDGKSFREQQCEKYNAYNYTDMDGNLLQWVPKYAGVSPRDRCKLFCRARGRSEFKVFEAKVIDGTLCGPETLAICVRGQCVKAGCDHVVDSPRKLDKCGVCGGKGNSCRKVSGSLNPSSYGYNDIVTIPAGATNIDVKQRSHPGVQNDGNYLALKTADGQYLLNGNLAISAIEQDILVKGTILKYSGSIATLERLQSFRPLPEPLTVQLLTVPGEVFPPKVKYTFFVPNDVNFSIQNSKERATTNIIQPLLNAQWVLGDWSECSSSCGAGRQRRTVECRDPHGQASATCNEALKPEDVKPCGSQPCPL
ncbi:A disintegrin and metalloproteinase with thrombospondin motifs 8 [Lynx canadensis]|uniref:A disintegrin and metalloproteinase with thrombospondin motifs 8 n=1 Tax=Lynx canadensis TaxID=61383 RepID=UPI0011B0BCD1|nr:A disintegrin and metalloproteinase with thrombospondin motifs 8 [Lynx canadensis]